MFGFLKKKLKEAVQRFTKGAKEKIVEEKAESVTEEDLQAEAELLEQEKEKVEDLTAEVDAKAKAAVVKRAEVPRQTTVESQGKQQGTRGPAKAAPVSPRTPVPKKPSISKPERRSEPEQATAVPIKKPVPSPPQRAVPDSIVEPAAPPAAQKAGTTIREKSPSLPKEVGGHPPQVPQIATPEEAPVKTGFFTRLKETFTKKQLSTEKFDELFWALEVTLLESSVAVEVIEKIKADLKEALTTGRVSRLGVEDLVRLSLRQSVEEILSVPGFDLVERIKKAEKPFIIAFIGVNGTGKTTTLAKIANLLQNEGFSVVMAASDTFRAAAIDQLDVHAKKLGVKLISQGYGADPAAVAYDAVEHAKARKVDVVMIDTAGRLHSNTNLMAELSKVVRVAKPDLKIFIGESVTGNDCIEQAKEFERVAGIDAIILSKADVDEKGGAALSVSYVTKKPILYLGTGQAYGDLRKFDKELLIRSLGL